MYYDYDGKLKLRKEYIAGYFDGEGTVYINPKKIKNKNKIDYTLVVHIGNLKKDVLEVIQSMYGGKIYPIIQENGKIFHRWMINSKKAYYFLIDIKNYCVDKRHAIDIAIEFRKTFNKNNHWKRNGVSKKIMVERKRLYELLKKTNHSYESYI